MADDRVLEGIQDRTILIAEDDAVNRKLLVRILRGLGYSTLVASDGREAVEAYESHHPNCILMDLHMPEMDGIEATRRIRAIGSEGKPPFIAALTADVMPETLTHSSLGALTPGSPVNLERAVRVDARLGGHIVQGHVDGVGTIADRTPGDRWEVVRVSIPVALARYVVDKGSITLDGVSLTVSGVGTDWLEVSLIPETLARTTLGTAAVGSPVNVEVDVLAKYVEKLVGGTR